MTLDEFTEESQLFDQPELDKVRLFAYYYLKAKAMLAFKMSDIVGWFEKYNLAKPNPSRLRSNIRSSRSFVNGNAPGQFRLHQTAIRELDALHGDKFLRARRRTLKSNSVLYVDHNRISELKALTPDDFDLSKLVRLCEELNVARDAGSFYTVGMAVRSIIDHVPPVFGCRNFAEVANNYPDGSRSFRASMQNLDTSSRKIGDQHLHTQIRKKETLPTLTQVDFSNDLDVLLGEVVRILK